MPVMRGSGKQLLVSGSQCVLNGEGVPVSGWTSPGSFAHVSKERLRCRYLLLAQNEAAL